MFKVSFLAAAAGMAALALPSVASADPHYGGHGQSQVRVVVGSTYGSGYSSYGGYYAPYAGYGSPYSGTYGAYAPSGTYSPYGAYGYGNAPDYRDGRQHARQHRKAERRHAREHQRRGH